MMKSILIVWFFLVGGVSLGQAAPKADLWPLWETHDSTSSLRVQHGKWQDFLDKYIVVDEEGIHRVKYAKVDEGGRQTLKAYLQTLMKTPVSELSRSSQMAYWINLYNALTVQVILDHYPVKSIKDIDISPGLFSNGPWGKKLIEIQNQALSLNDIEHRILRPIWRDPRVHYAVNCASLGCPNLSREAYRSEVLEQQLDRAAREFINHPRGVQLKGGSFYLSSIYKWFRSDFGENSQQLIEHLRKYASPEHLLQWRGKTKIKSYDYDWQLNVATDP